MLIIEDGSGVTNANSFVTSDDAAVFFNARDLDVPDDAMLLQAMDILIYLTYLGLSLIHI